MSTLHRWPGRLAREPLVQFLAGGALLFVLWKATAASGPHVVTLDVAVLAALEGQQENLLGRPLFAAERDALRERYVDGELLLEEAVRRELHLADAATRARLVQVMRGVLATPPPAPTRGELERWMRAHFDRFASPEAITLEQIPFAPGEPAGDEALAVALTQLRAGADPASFGTRGFSVARQLSRKSRRELENMLGDSFAERVQDLTQGAWSGPIDSPHARHLVRVVERHARELPAFEAIENHLRSEWHAEHRRELQRQRMDELRAGYRVRWSDE